MKKAFTLIELLIVLVIIGVLVTLAVPQYQEIKEKAIAAEAINIINSIKDHFIILKMEGISDPYVHEERFGILPDTEYWAYGIGKSGGGDFPIWIASARRKSGSYLGYWIQLFWNSETGEGTWEGNHPGTPGGTIAPPW